MRSSLEMKPATIWDPISNEFVKPLYLIDTESIWGGTGPFGLANAEDMLAAGILKGVIDPPSECKII